jgi:hypothetical protein
MAKPLHCAAVDLGATSGRVILGTWAKGRLTLKEVHRFPNALRSAGGHDYWDIPGLWQEVQAGLQAAVAALPKGATLASVGVDTWGVDYVLTNDAGRIVFPTHAYRDARTQPGLQHLSNTRAALDRIYAATGIPAVFYNSSFQLAETVEKFPALGQNGQRPLHRQHDPAPRRPRRRLVTRCLGLFPRPAPLADQAREIRHEARQGRANPPDEQPGRTRRNPRLIRRIRPT